MDALTTSNQNQAIGLSNISTALGYALGQFTSLAYTGDDSAVQVYTGRGRLVSVTVLNGSPSGVKFYNTSSASSLPEANLTYVVPPNSSIGVLTVGLQFTNGLAAYINSGVTINVTYSAG